jgi:hypothetical protein
MLYQRSPTSHLNTDLQATRLSTVEKRPTLYSLFFPSIYYIFILVVIGLGGILCIIRLYNQPERKISIDEGLSNMVTTHISSLLINDGYHYSSDTLLRSPERLILIYKSDQRELKFNVQIYQEASKDLVSHIPLSYRLDTESSDFAVIATVKKLQDRLNHVE